MWDWDMHVGTDANARRWHFQCRGMLSAVGPWLHAGDISSHDNQNTYRIGPQLIATNLGIRRPRCHVRMCAKVAKARRWIRDADPTIWCRFCGGRREAGPLLIVIETLLAKFPLQSYEQTLSSASLLMDDRRRRSINEATAPDYSLPC